MQKGRQKGEDGQIYIPQTCQVSNPHAHSFGHTSASPPTVPSQPRLQLKRRVTPTHSHVQDPRTEKREFELQYHASLSRLGRPVPTPGYAYTSKNAALPTESQQNPSPDPKVKPRKQCKDYYKHPFSSTQQPAYSRQTHPLSPIHFAPWAIALHPPIHLPPASPSHSAAYQPPPQHSPLLLPPTPIQPQRRHPPP